MDHSINAHGMGDEDFSSSEKSFNMGLRFFEDAHPQVTQKLSIGAQQQRNNSAI